MASTQTGKAMTRAWLSTLPLLLLTLSVPVRSISEAQAAQTGQAGLCEQEIHRASAKYGVPEGILYSVGLAETGKKGSLQPWALNIEGKAVFAASPNDALTIFQQARQKGAVLIDLGCMQINHHFHGSAFASPAQMLEPALNVEYAAKFLAELHARHETWTMAVARYHAGPNNDPAQKQYVCRVISNLVASGYGQWTKNASQFCVGYN